MWSAAVGSTARNGPTSSLTLIVPGPPIVQAAKGLGPDTSVSGATPALTTPAKATTPALTATNTNSLRDIAPPFLYDVRRCGRRAAAGFWQPRIAGAAPTVRVARARRVAEPSGRENRTVPRLTEMGRVGIEPTTLGLRVAARRLGGSRWSWKTGSYVRKSVSSRSCDLGLSR